MKWWLERVLTVIWFGAWAGMAYAAYNDFQRLPQMLEASVARNESLLEDVRTIRSRIDRLKSNIHDIDRAIKSRSGGVWI